MSVDTPRPALKFFRPNRGTSRQEMLELPSAAGSTQQEGVAVPPPQSADPRNLQLRGYGTDATLSSGGSPGSDTIPLNCSGEEYQYIPQDSSDDQGDPPRGGYDLKNGKKDS